MKIMNEEESFREKQEYISSLVENVGNDPLYLDGWEGGLIGWNRDDNGDVQAVYSEELMLDYWTRANDSTIEDATEFYEYNTVRSLPYVDSRNRPIIIHTV